MNKKIATCAAIVGVACGVFAEGLLLVLPANENLINLGFDLMRMKPAGAIELLCYGGADEVKTMESFDRGQWRWVSIPQSAWINGTIRGASGDTLVIVGDGQVASDLLDSAVWAKNILTPSGHSFHEVANAVHSVSPLTRKQWKALEKGYGIRMREITVPSRYDRYDRYERRERGEAAPKAAPAAAEVDLGLTPTEVIVTTPPADDTPAVQVVETAPVAVEVETPAAPVAVEPAPVAVEVETPAAPAAVETAPVAVEVETPAAPAAVESAPVVVESAPVAVEVETPAAPAAEAEAAGADVRRTVQQALEKAKAEVEGARAEVPPATALEVPAPEVDLGAEATLKVPEIPVLPATTTVE